MNKLKIYQIDAFTDKVFGGNPAAVCVLEDWLPDTLMQSIATENNLAETAFLVKVNEQYHIRWFTPTVEVDLCGHATLASAHVLYEFGFETAPKIQFYSHRSGELPVEKTEDLYTLDFPADSITEIELPVELSLSFSKKPLKVYKGKTDYMLVFENEETIKALAMDFEKLAKADCRGVIVTAKGNSVDFVSRFFAPQSGINEDPVTGSAHTTLTPYWANRLNKTNLTAMQVSKRGGHLKVSNEKQRVKISGKAVTYLVGEIFL
ncbi:MAG TPA: PhzF family phenazine biosynthesis protein [Pelobium sp.]|nr:PhzF family phenazine biosynthesis protein [Pelobium sp.]